MDDVGHVCYVILEAFWTLYQSLRSDDLVMWFSLWGTGSWQGKVLLEDFAAADLVPEARIATGLSKFVMHFFAT